MDINLIHPSIRRLGDKVDVKLSNIIKNNKGLCLTISEFVKRTNICSDIVKNKYEGYYDFNTYKGDAFEVLVEFLIKSSPFDNRIGILNYDPIISSEDYGVDGAGQSLVDMSPVTVQIKFRSNKEKYLTPNEDHISNFVSKSYSTYFKSYIDNLLTGKSKGKNIDCRNMLIITTAKDLNPIIAKKCIMMR